MTYLNLSKRDLLDWISDLQSGLYINCVYCGHRYGPQDEEIPSDMLRRHVASCPEHPMSQLVDSCKEILRGIETRRRYGGAGLLQVEEDIESALKVAIESAEE